jgi:hypothetical protein
LIELALVEGLGPAGDYLLAPAADVTSRGVHL